MTTLPKGLKFRIAKGRSWNGNGFGTDSALWVAEYNGKEIGKWQKPASGMPIVIVNGRQGLSSTSHKEWKEKIIKSVS